MVLYISNTLLYQSLLSHHGGTDGMLQVVCTVASASLLYFMRNTRVVPLTQPLTAPMKQK